MFQVTRQADYGLLLITALAGYGPGEFVSLREIAERRKLPYRFLTKIMVPLRKAGLVKSQEGARGGYALAKAPADIQIREVLEALGEDLALVRCETNDKNCQSFCQCSARGFWHELQDQMDQVMSKYTIKDLLVSKAPVFKSNVTFNS
jgi:Rrf2 family protein